MLLHAGRARSCQVSGRTAGTPAAAGVRGGPSRGRAVLELRVLARPQGLSVFGLTASVPWCCIVPAALASLGLASSAVAHWIHAATPLLLVMSVAVLARAHYELWVKRHAAPLARALTLLLTLLAAALWALRLSPNFASFVLG